MIARLIAILRGMPSTLGRMGGYWGGVTMRALAFLRDSGAKAAAFLRRG